MQPFQNRKLNKSYWKLDNASSLYAYMTGHIDVKCCESVPGWQKQENDGVYLEKYLTHQDRSTLPSAKDAVICNFLHRDPNRRDHTFSCHFLFSSHFLRQLQWSTLGSTAGLTPGKPLELLWFWESSQISTHLPKQVSVTCFHYAS